MLAQILHDIPPCDDPDKGAGIVNYRHKVLDRDGIQEVFYICVSSDRAVVPSSVDGLQRLVRRSH